MIHIYTDGACSQNPGPGGWAAVILTNKGYEILAGTDRDTTNNRMELMAVLKAVKYIKVHGYEDVTIYSDSAYVVNAVNGYLKSWFTNGWKKSNGDSIKNKKLWIELYRIIKMINIKMIKVKGHSGDEHNEVADLMATQMVKILKDDK